MANKAVVIVGAVVIVAVAAVVIWQYAGKKEQMAGPTAAADVVKERKEGFKGNKEAAAAIKKVVEAGGPAADVVAPAQKIADWATKIPGHFPKGSDKGDTKAKPEIWAKWDDFTKAASNNHEAALKLVAAAKTGDMGAVKSAFGAMGATCGACHKQFKEE